jgi:hypothetical protein
MRQRLWLVYWLAAASRLQVVSLAVAGASPGCGCALLAAAISGRLSSADIRRPATRPVQNPRNPETSRDKLALSVFLPAVGSLRPWNTLASN